MLLPLNGVLAAEVEYRRRHEPASAPPMVTPRPDAVTRRPHPDAITGTVYRSTDGSG